MRTIQHSFRSLARNPGFTIAAVLTLALGIGASVGVFAVLSATILRPLPYREPDGIVFLWETKQQVKTDQITVSPANYADWRASNHVFSSTAFFMGGEFNLMKPGPPEKLTGLQVTADYFNVLGVRPRLGRTFYPDEDKPAAARVAVISDALWRSRLGARADAVGQSLEFDSGIYTVIGVMPSDFDFPILRKWQLWTPYIADSNAGTDRRAHLGAAIGRLREGVTLAGAQADLDAIAAQLEREYPASNTGSGVRVLSLREQVQGTVRRPLLIVFGSVLVLLLIACSNVANLLLVRSARLRSETAIRVALGAEWWDLAKQRIAEGLLLAGAGGMLGVLLASSFLPVLRAMPVPLPRLEQASMDWRILAFSLLAIVICTLFFAVVPMLPFASGEPAGLRGSGKGGGGLQDRRARFALRAFVVTEVALALLLLTGAGVLMESLRHLLSLDPGFRPERVMTVGISYPKGFSQSANPLLLERNLLRGVLSLPNVFSAGLTSDLPLSGRSWTIQFSIEGRPNSTGDFLASGQRVITPGFFEAMGIPIRAGRFFDQRDTAGRPLVAVVNDAFARKFFGRENPLGHRVKWGNAVDRDFPWWFTIAGVAGDVRHSSMEEAPAPELYMSRYQLTGELAGMAPGSMTLAVLSNSDAGPLAAALRQQIQHMDPRVVMAAPQSMERVLADSLTSRRFQTTIIAGFGGLALILAWIGIYGVVAYSTALRTHEFGIRMALGSRPLDVVRLVTLDAARMTTIGIATGLALSSLATRALAPLAGVEPGSTLVSCAIAATLYTTAFWASYLPARRAGGIHPAASLRCD